MIKIPIAQGYTALVDDEDAHLAEMRWYANVRKHTVYAARTVPGNGVSHSAILHREVLGLRRGDGKIVDHINGNGLDCRRSNLRVVTNQENLRNRGGAQPSSVSGILGVTRRKDGWLARIKIDGKPKNLGLFSTAEEANLARLKAEMEAWGIQPRRRAAFQEAGFLTKGGA